MTPRRLDRDRITEALRSIELFAGDLEPHAGVTAAELVDDRQRRNAIERALIGIVDLAISVGTHLLAHLGRRQAPTYRGSFEALEAAGVVDASTAATFGSAAGMRNILVHQYTQIDPEVVARAATTMPADARRYVEQVAGWLLDQPAE
ncbi:MAG: DUF86 domain-containing protein [Ilumatobacteraceae bacterium]|jgi:uncharacterized protein YutE (UPF0331/DUF86 family)|nr:DUF86 domain-containing protein [Ilumatobacteraceae bacterium]